MEDRFYESYRLVDFYDEMYSTLYDIDFWYKYIKPNDSVLELACGTGRLTIPLLRRGNTVHAVDYSQEMLDILEQKMQNESNEIKSKLTFEACDMRNLKIEKTFDVVIIAANSLNHIEKNEDLEKVLVNLRSILKPDGYLLFDVLNPKFEFLLRNRNSFYDEQVLYHKKNETHFVFKETSEYCSKTQINEVTYLFNYSDSTGQEKIGDVYIMNMFVRLFFPQEIDYYISKAGYKIVEKCGSYDGRVFTGQENEQIFVLKSVDT